MWNIDGYCLKKEDNEGSPSSKYNGEKTKSTDREDLTN